ncbi:MAG: FAD-binding oxidoreductase [Asgard group archaeon]|nr:FAD-binding oxidoreductase [Asgard group archaeon]
MTGEIIYNKKRKKIDSKKIKTKLIEIFGIDYVSNKEIDLLSYSKDFSPIYSQWTLEGKTISKPDFIVWPQKTNQLVELMKYATSIEIPIIPFGEGSGVVGGAIPIFGGIIVDMKHFDKILEVNNQNLTTTIQTGKNGMNIERELNQLGFTLGHIPQSVYTSSLGGYLAHKAAGQFSTKYGKIEDMVLGLEAVLPTGEVINTKITPRSSVGPQIDKLLLGSEGTLAIITQATLRIWPKPEKQTLISYCFKTIEDSLNAVREILRNQAYPAVVRIYDAEETERSFYGMKNLKNKYLTIFVCEGNQYVVDTEEKITRQFCEKYNGLNCGEEPVHHWLEKRFTVTESSTMPLLTVIYDTIEVAVMWDTAAVLFNNVIKAMKSINGTVIASGHASHFYPQGVCFYFSFGGTPINQSGADFSKKVWEACIKATIDSGGTISHHHGIGIIRSNWMKDQWGTSFPLLKKIKQCLDPKNILNPGKLYEGKIE